ncbi:hypothetical protein TOPH_02067 [Tolypocladium ophioglossoides CBS 100239]|uniref:Uncharacterized protein n=1 Tax=Tolypocladium ophioglossoides (strain CBS 100239) TaxID=1163406 RepID=A0A0L0NGL6_TOLOC|nr:hypothetical protein TOPH_02067 [Tolypocladium ophioglossoides CBS 100239]
MPMSKALDAAANIRDLQARRGRPSIAERRRTKRIRRLAAQALSAPLACAISFANVTSDEKGTKRRRKVYDAADAASPCTIVHLIPDLQHLLDAQRPLGVKLDELKRLRYDVFDDKRPLLRLLDEHFPERSSYTGRLLDTSRAISGLIQRLQEHCRAKQDPVLTAVRVATVVNIVVEESTIEIQNYRYENPDSPSYESEEQEYKLQQLRDQLRLFVNALVQTKLAAPSRRMAQVRKLELAFAHSADSPLRFMI